MSCVFISWLDFGHEPVHMTFTMASKMEYINSCFLEPMPTPRAGQWVRYFQTTKTEWSRGAFLKLGFSYLKKGRWILCNQEWYFRTMSVLTRALQPLSVFQRLMGIRADRCLVTARELLCSMQEMPSAGAPLLGITRYPIWYNFASVGTLPSLCAAVLLPSASVKTLAAS